MDIGYKLYEDFSDDGRVAFEKAQLQMALTCEATGWCMEDGYDEDGKRYLIINPPEPEHVPTQEEIEAQALADAKRERAKAVDRLTVEVEGMVFDGDEVSQARMAVAASSMTDDETNIWVLHDNSVVQVTKAQLLQACRLARIAQSAVWTKPYEAS
jgi:hypothetical protein